MATTEFDMSQTLSENSHSVNTTKPLMVSMVKDATATECRNASADAIIKHIREGKWEAKVLAVQSAQTPEERSKAKKKLPGILWCGRFSERNAKGLVAYSRLIPADLDNVPLTDMGAANDALEASPHCAARFCSPGGRGIKAIFKVSADENHHRESFRAVQKHVREITGMEIDASGADVCRVCFVSSDPNAYYNPNAIPLDVPLEAPTSEVRPTSNGDLNERQRIAQSILGPITWEADGATGFCQCPGRHLHTTGNGPKDFKVHVDAIPTLSCFHGHCRPIIESINHKLRSEIGKVEFIQSAARAQVVATDDDAPILEPIPPYTPPPLDLLPGPLQEFILAGAESLNVDTSYLLLPSLSSLGAAIGDACNIILKPGYTQGPIIWTGVIGRSGSKKTPALELGATAMRERERDLVRVNREAKQKFEIELEKWQNKDKEKRGPKPEPPPVLTCLLDDLTVASVASCLADNPRGLLVAKDELSHWIASFDQFNGSKGADVTRWLSLHAGVMLGLDRKTNRESLRLFNPRVGITGMIQPKVLKRCLTEDFFDRGLPARFLFAYPPDRVDSWSELVVPEPLHKAVGEIFNNLFALEPDINSHGERQPRVVNLDAGAKSVFVEFYNLVGAAASEADEKAGAAWQKTVGHGARLALVGHLARGGGAVIDRDTMRAATALALWAAEESSRIYRLLSEGPLVGGLRKLMEFISRRGGSVTVREVVSNFWPLKGRTDEAEAQLNQLVQDGYGVWIDRPSGPKGGHPTREFRSSAQPQNSKKTEDSQGCADAEEEAEPDAAVVI